VYSVFTGDFIGQGKENEEMVCSRDSGVNSRGHVGAIRSIGSARNFRGFYRRSAKLVTQHSGAFAALSPA
jgi:hypothetical protein